MRPAEPVPDPTPKTDAPDRALRRAARARFHAFGAQPGRTNSRVLRTQIEPVATGRLPELGLSWAGDTKSAQSEQKEIAEDDLRGRTARVEQTLGRQMGDLGLLENVRRVHELDAENFRARAEEHKTTLESLKLEVSELESKVCGISGGDRDAQPEGAKAVRARLETLKADVRSAGEKLTQGNTALAARGRALLEVQRKRLCERAARCLAEVREI